MAFLDVFTYSFEEDGLAGFVRVFHDEVGGELERRGGFGGSGK